MVGIQKGYPASRNTMLVKCFLEHLEEEVQEGKWAYWKWPSKHLSTCRL